MAFTTSPMFSKSLSRAGHVHRFVISACAPAGWEVREERDSTVVKQVCLTDWHRVERARTLFSMRALLLQNAGWVEAASSLT